MKRFTILAVLALLSFSNIQAQPKKGGWQEKMMSEKIAFITMELQLTPEEAQVFWPVYNQIAQEKKETQKAMMTAFRAMKKALAEGTASDKEINALLDTYLAARQIHKESGKGDVDKYRKVLPAQKVAKLYVAEENFRRQHIRNFKGGHKGPGGAGHPAQGGNGSGRPAQGQGGGKPGARG
ncbi:MAG: hypothetical protein E7123_08675 [Bacteroidales bacterium]|nr:hypothetical protein [Bacteroidales bacterium]